MVVFVVSALLVGCATSETAPGNNTESESRTSSFPEAVNDLPTTLGKSDVTIPYHPSSGGSTSFVIYPETLADLLSKNVAILGVVESYGEPEEHVQLLLTPINFRVEESLSGDIAVGSVITYLQLAGMSGKVSEEQRIAGLPTLATQILLFAQPATPSNERTAATYAVGVRFIVQRDGSITAEGSGGIDSDASVVQNYVGTTLDEAKRNIAETKSKLLGPTSP